MHVFETGAFKIMATPGDIPRYRGPRIGDRVRVVLEGVVRSTYNYDDGEADRPVAVVELDDPRGAVIRVSAEQVTITKPTTR